MRSIVTGAILSALSASAACAQAAGPVSGVSIVMSDLMHEGWEPFLPYIKAELQDELRTALGPLLTGGRGGDRLVVEVKTLRLNSYAGSAHHRGAGGSDNDYLESQATLYGPRGEVLQTQPILSALPASSGGAWYSPDSEKRRLSAIARHNGWWIKTMLFGR